RPAAELGPETTALRSAGVALETGGHTQATFTGADLVAVSPGVPLTIAPIAAARRHGVRVVAEVEVASWFLRGTLIGITGSNGKSTTTALAGHLLASAGLDAVACGNLGTPLSSLVATDDPKRHYVVELSSFQLEGIETFRPAIAALLNLSPDHQDRYPTMRDYYDAKARIFMNQGPADHAILNADDPEVTARFGAVRARRWLFSRHDPVEDGAQVADGWVVLRRGGRDTRVMRVADLPLFGRHNEENVLAALLIADRSGVSPERAADGVRSFRGLPHRLELVRTLDGVRWFNDSKATNVGATEKSLLSFENGVVLILGGKDKGGKFEELEPLLRGRVTHLILLGKARETIRRALGDVVPTTLVEDLHAAVAAALTQVRPGGVVLLAPACASFDQYSGFEARGEHFRKLVGALPGGGA
ncbi:MAG TPA: UDP-N-acetylmuramoyl-L-alanine--D-glutamate ligase, partial [Candidatus Polarisedimenticolia bacterium]|nr:UDP-N-acetylmuramoyl-L-alanine--D-glutamate ligase [Candidatus Polarisedimenticolia bacterium]